MATSGQKIVLITGGNQGLGFETAKILLTSPDYHVVLGSRKLANGDASARALRADPHTRGTVSAIQLDVTDDRSVDAAATQIAADHDHLDILVNNAGVLSLVHPPNRASFRDVLNVNVVGSLSMAETFLPLLRKSEEKRVVFVSSSVGSLALTSDPTSPTHSSTGFEYRSSKAAVNMLIVLYHNRLQKEGFKILGADPGLNATNFSGNAEALRERGAVTPDVGGERIARVVRGEEDGCLGHTIGKDGVNPW